MKYIDSYCYAFSTGRIMVFKNCWIQRFKKIKTLTMAWSSSEPNPWLTRCSKIFHFSTPFMMNVSNYKREQKTWSKTPKRSLASFRIKQSHYVTSQQYSTVLLCVTYTYQRRFDEFLRITTLAKLGCVRYVAQLLCTVHPKRYQF